MEQAYFKNKNKKIIFKLNFIAKKVFWLDIASAMNSVP